MQCKVDRPARDQAASILRRFLSGKMNNDAFEASMPDSGDPAIPAIWDSAWMLCCDIRSHKLVEKHSLHPMERQYCLRWLLFLDSDEPYAWPDRAHPGFRHPNEAVARLFSLGRHRRMKEFFDAGDYRAWPFVRRRDLDRALRAPRRLSGRSRDSRPATENTVAC